ncbi:putative secreted protein [Corynebacterium kutscheri]|uniref:Secreted protein n=1 Tax=Corynebacterium kutscheri TaxID=35755 RepID=A0A0F6R0W3_9CORY|nr:hypothetical protein [Corynebacterium kutscheri]AKE41525.1 hypothetical protein UL82_06800 [Corynebacterium kutscheri]VEH08803.1 putative secreted protein [Corynebacterium kutscheri]VEH09849.1 putative secreted protein [Corynebacterium kutscheri]VEH79932.1 putative secreted protein [Corynebacterium kutscheri]
MRSFNRCGNITKVLTATVATSALFLSACGSDDKASVETTTSATSTKASTTVETTATTVVETTPTEAAPEPEVSETIDIEALQQTINSAPVEPVTGGQLASPEDAAAIEGLVRGIGNATTLRSYISYIPENACSAVVQEYGGQTVLDYSQIPDVPLNDIPEYRNAQASIGEITNIMVDGDWASASVTATAGGETTTETQRFFREDGRWKFCR